VNAMLQDLLRNLVRHALHLWAGPPGNLEVACPPPLPGEVAGSGFFDPRTVAGAYESAGWISMATVILLTVVCYAFTRFTTGSAFRARWLRFTLAAAILSAALATLVLFLAPTRALAETCETLPEAFRAPLPWKVILSRTLAGFVWGPCAFLVVSVVLTQTAGRFPWFGGFFHNRGIPWPRLLR
jgi:hypothetical protein